MGGKAWGCRRRMEEVQPGWRGAEPCRPGEGLLCEQCRGVSASVAEVDRRRKLERAGGLLRPVATGASPCRAGRSAGRHGDGLRLGAGPAHYLKKRLLPVRPGREGMGRENKK